MEPKIEIYNAQNGIDILVKIEQETVWLNAHLIAKLFNVNRPAIVKHILNIYKSNELSESSTCSNLEQVATDGKKRKMNLYNLDMIISVGYRVNSKEATQFRKWATQRLKEYLVQGYSVNQKRLDELGQMVLLVQNATQFDTIQLQEAKGLLEILSKYTKSFVLLNQYDSNAISNQNLNENITYEIEYDEAKYAVEELKRQLIFKKEATELLATKKMKASKVLN